MCIFCDIISGDIPANPVYEDNDYIVLNDLHPKARIHMLFIPKKHIESIARMDDMDSPIVSRLFVLARNLGKDMNIPGYKLLFNVEKAGGQEIMHLHLHLMAE